MAGLKTIIRGFGMSAFFFFATAMAVYSQAQFEKLNRGIAAVRHEEGKAFVSWRLLGGEPENIAFNLYRKTGGGQAEKLNATPLTEGTCFVDSLADFTKDNAYYVKSLVRNKEGKESESFAIPANAPVRQYLSIPLKTPEGYSPGDASVGDLDGDGEYEIIVHQTGRGRDNSHQGETDEPIFDAYKMDGTLLWRINLGKNIREGAHYTQFLVYDLDGDGKAEFVCKTADGTKDGMGNVIGDPEADHRNPQGHILKGSEFLTVFNGQTGEAMATVDYIPGRHPEKTDPGPQELKEIWGDNYGNRSDRYLAAVAYLDGKRPSIVMARGYYTRSVLAAWNWRNGKMTHQWTFDSDDGTAGAAAFRGQGNHNLSVGDVDGDGKDEIIYGAAVIDDNGKGLYSTGLGHGDALHFSDLDPERPGLEVFNTQERFDDAGMNFRDAATGEIIWKVASVKAAESGGDRGEGPGRGVAFDVDPIHPGSECWVFGAGITGMYNSKGEKISEKTPSSCNFAVWWDGDLLREILDRNVISKWDWEKEELKPLLVAEECSSNNGSKATPALSVDLFGDWREEVIWRTLDNQELRIYTTAIPTNYRFPTLMHDHIYRMGIVWQNVAYNQPPHTGFYLGEDKK